MLLQRLIQLGQAFGITIEDFTIPWSNTQSVDIYEQLRHGIRYLVGGMERGAAHSNPPPPKHTDTRIVERVGDSGRSLTLTYSRDSTDASAPTCYTCPSSRPLVATSALQTHPPNPTQPELYSYTLTEHYPHSSG